MIEGYGQEAVELQEATKRKKEDGNNLVIASSRFWSGWPDEDMTNLKDHEKLIQFGLNQDLKM